MKQFKFYEADEILESNYIEAYWNSPSWKEQKEVILKKWQTKRPDLIIKVNRVRTDTKGLRCYIVLGFKKEEK